MRKTLLHPRGESRNLDHWIRFAELFIIAIESLPARRDELAGQAIALLEKSISLGFDEFPRLKGSRICDTKIPSRLHSKGGVT
jgi:hypothetical protein